MKNETKSEKENFEERPFTFKITKKRSPWTPEEDEAITALVNKYGTGNWTLIANEMSNLFGHKNRSGKQCRERWHNHLDPNINKDYWTEKEENVLFMKHMEYGNKWSDIAKFLPGRTDNAIKNHFYSKLRKFIRKMLKQINKDNLLKANGIDPNKYNSDRVYKMIKKNKIPYNSLNKEAMLGMILNYEKNHKIGKSEMQMLKSKTNRRKTKGYNGNFTENLYDEKINKRKATFTPENFLSYGETYPTMATRTRSRAKTVSQSLIDINNDYINYNNYNNFLTGTPGNQMSLYNDKTNLTTRSRRSKNENIYSMPRSRRSLRKRNIDEDFFYEDEQIPSGIKSENNNEENGKELAKRNLNMIINKSVLFNNYMREEEERRSSGIKSVEFTPNKFIQKDIFFPSAGYTQVSNVNIMPSTTSQSNLLLDDRIYRTSNNIETFPYMDQGIPLLSPINPNAKLYPNSTRNYFNIDLLNEGNYQIPLTMQNYNMFRQPGVLLPSTGYITSPNLTGIALTPIQQQNLALTPNKEIALHNKILINESDLFGMQNYNIGRNKNYQLVDTSKKEEFSSDMKNRNISRNSNNLIDYSDIQLHKRKSAALNKKPSLDLTIINENETGKIFKQSLTRSVSDLHTSDVVAEIYPANVAPLNENKSIAIKPEEISEKIENKNFEEGKSDTANIQEELNPKEISQEYQVVPIQERDQPPSEEEKENLAASQGYQLSQEEKDLDTISVTNTSEKSGSNQNSNLINESNVNRFDLLNMYNLSNVNREGQINKPTLDTNLTTQLLPQHETKAIFNISPKSAFVKMK